MPIPVFLMGAAQIFFIIHAARTGRPYYWFFILLFVPMLGILAYVLFELLPHAGSSASAQKTVSGARRLIDPQGRYRALATNLEVAPTVLNMRALADECVTLGRLDEAERLYSDALQGLHATDPYTMLGLARVRFARGDSSGCLQTLDDIKVANPDFQNTDAHMLFARALEASSRNEEALREYASLSRYFAGEEPRVRSGLLLSKLGDRQTALEQFEEVRRSVERSPSFYRRNQREWYKLALQNLKA
jgi:hypothetical protein